MSTRLALRIQERFEKLSPSERRLAEILLERQNDVLTYSATEMAEMAGVSKATAARLFRSLGYSDFNEVRLQAREERNRTAPFQQQKAETAVPAGARSISLHLAAEIASLTRTFEELRSDRLTQAARLIAEAPRVWLLGFGLEEGFAMHTRATLARLRADVMLMGSYSGSWGEDFAMTGPRDALVILLGKTRPKVLRQILGYALTSRMNVVAIADSDAAVWASRFASVVLPCQSSDRPSGIAGTAMISMVRLLCAAVGEHIGGAADLRTDLIAEIHEELQDLD